VLRAFLGRAHLHIELKSKQADLPKAVSLALHPTGWVGEDGAPTPAALGSSPCSSGDKHQHRKLQDSEGGTGQTLPEVQEDSGAWVAPGLTITSFHLQQLKSSKALLPGVRHAWLVQEVTPEVLQVG
jgi:hypothetical protein